MEVKKEKQTTISRRRLLGAMLLGTGTMVSGFGFKTSGQKMKNKGKILLNRMPQIPRGLEEAVKFTLIEALHGRRARRFCPPWWWKCTIRIRRARRPWPGGCRRSCPTPTAWWPWSRTTTWAGRSAGTSSRWRSWPAIALLKLRS